MNDNNTVADKYRNVDDMGEEKISKLLVRFSLPATLGMIVMASYNIVDAAFVGRLGSDALAALSVAFPIQMVFGALAIGTGVGAASLISRALGAGNREQAVMAVGQLFLLAVIYTILTTAGGRFFLEPLLILFGATPDIIGLTMDYMIIIIDWSVMLYFIMMLNNSVRAEGNAMLPMKVMIISAVINIILDPIFIFYLEMGIRGAAVATVIAKVAGVVMLLWHYIGGKSPLEISYRHFKPHLATIGEIYKVGIPTILVQMSHNIALIVTNRVLGAYGYTAIAAMGLVFRLQMFALMPVIGISQGLLPIIGFNFGAKKIMRIREALFKGIAAASIIIFVMTVLMFAFPELILRIFTSDEALLEMGTFATRIMVVMWPLLAIPIIGGVFFQAIGKGIPALMISLLRQLIFYVPLLLILPNIFDLTGVWLTMPLADFLTFAFSILLVLRELKKRNIPLRLE